MHEPTGIVFMLDHEGQTFSFCDPACVDTFRDDPGRWTQDVSAASAE